MPQVYHQMRKGSNNCSFYPLKPIIDEINNLPNTQWKNGIKIIDDFAFDRLKWLKFWANNAVELYGDDAYISFC